MDKFKYHLILALSVALLCSFFMAAQAEATEKENDGENVRAQYEEYLDRLGMVENRADIEECGFKIVEDQIFPIPLVKEEETEEEKEEDGEQDESQDDEIDEDTVFMIPAFDTEYNRLALFFADYYGNILYKTEMLETNSSIRGRMRQPNKEIVAVSFQDLNKDMLTDVIIITSCVYESGDYAGKTYKVGDVLFQSPGGDGLEFYRDYRIAEKINRFGMNKSAELIAAYVKDGRSTEFLYVAATLSELQQHGFHIIQEQCYTRTFGKLGKLQVVPGTYRIADYDFFMIYLVDEQGYIVSGLQPMGEYDNLYALKGVSCRDIDGDGLKDIIVLARYSYAGEGNQIIIESDYRIYYQRTGGFSDDTQIKNWYRCSDEDTMEALVEKARAYWGWKTEDD